MQGWEAAGGSDDGNVGGGGPGREAEEEEERAEFDKVRSEEKTFQWVSDLEIPRDMD